MGSCFLVLGTTDSKQTKEQIIGGTKSCAKNQDSVVVKRLECSQEVGGQGRPPWATCKSRSEKHKEAGTLHLNGRAFQAEETVSTKPRDGHELGVF